MKTKLKFRIVFSLIVIVLANTGLSAQQKVSTYLRGGLQDANFVVDKYLSPLGNSMGFALNGGWFNTAKTHSTLGFDLTLTANAIFIPAADKSYEFNNANNKSLFLLSGTKATVPTLFGAKADGPLVGVKNPDYNQMRSAGVPDSLSYKYLAKFNLPQGEDFPVSLLPTLQLRVGLFKNTDIIVRYLPDTKVNKFKIGLWGIGFMHDVKQWIPVVNKLPFDLSLQFGYTQMHLNVDFPDQLLPEPGAIDMQTHAVPSTTTAYKTQSFTYSNTAWNANLIVSKKLLFFTPYLALGYNNAGTDLKVKGNYPVVQGAYYNKANPKDPLNGKLETSDIADPINVSNTITSTRLTVGFQLKLAILTLHADYTLSKYPVASAGLGFTLR